MMRLASKETGTSVPAASTNVYFACRMCGRALAAKAWGGAECGRCRSISAQTPAQGGMLQEFHQVQNHGLAAIHREQRHRQQLAERCLAIVKRHVGEGLLVNVGSTPNPFPNLAEQHGFDVTALGDVLPKGLSPSIRFREGGIHNDVMLGQLRGVFDVVTAWGAMERLAEPRSAADVLSRLCRPGGKLFLSTPEVGTFLTNHSLGRSAWLHASEHLCLPSPLAVTKVFKSLGCRTLTWGRLDANPWRSATSVALGLAETAGGMAVKVVLPKAWQSLRDSRCQRYRGTTYFVFERH